MSPLRHAIRQQCSHFHTNPTPRISSPLFALQALANSRETQHFSRASGLSRIEHSPNLELLRSSEVDPFKRKKPAGPPDEARKPHTPEQQRARVKNDSVPKVIPSALGKRDPARIGTSEGAAAFSGALAGTSSTETNALNVGSGMLMDRTSARVGLREEIRELEERQAAKRRAWKHERRELERKIEEHEQRRFINGVLLGIFILGSAWWYRDRLVRWVRDRWGVWEARTTADTAERLMELRRIGVGVTATQGQTVDAVDTIGNGGRETSKEAAKSSRGWFWRS